ncbi:MAG: N-acetylmuramoyl-L-alanine amidase [Chloroflexi bacterium]|nr:N-acetylmuramoyl-L-alanine amidase [Chloroflexota bacterium]
MKAVFLSCLACFLLGGASSRGAEVRLKTFDVLGQSCVDLQDWAETKQLNLDWNKKEEEVRLTNRWFRLFFKVNSRRAELNGIAVWLSYAIASKNNSLYIARTDLDTLLEPVLHPARSKTRVRINTVALDAGHGGKDPGNQEGSRQEKTYTLLLAKEVQNRLGQAGLKSVLIRSTDKYIDLEERPALAKRKGADLFLSLHYNSGPAGSNPVNGVEIFCLTPTGASPTNGGDQPSKASPGNRHEARNVLLAYQMQKAIVQNLGWADRGVRRAGFVVLRKAEMPAALIEAGFMSDPAEARKIYDPAYRRRMAQAIVEGLLAYKRLVER